LRETFMKALLTLLLLAAISAGVFALGSFRKEGADKPMLHVAEEVALTVNVAKPREERSGGGGSRGYGNGRREYSGGRNRY